MYQQATRTITRRNIKATETRLRGGLGQVLPTIVDPGFKAIFDWITGKTGEYKLEATSFAENAVKVFYGLEPDCSMPPAGIDIVPGNPTPRFCSASVAGEIERCHLSDASSLLSQTKSMFTTRMNNPADPVAPYIKRWYDQYGVNDFSNLQLKINSASATCGLVGQVPKICPQGYTFSPSLLKCVNADGQTIPPTTTTPGGGLNLSSMSGPIMMMAFAGIAMLILSRR